MDRKLTLYILVGMVLGVIVALLLGASGGPKWFVLAGIDEYLARDWLPLRRTPLDMLGSSAGAWRLCALAQPDPLAASRRLADCYSNLNYPANASRALVTDISRQLLDALAHLVSLTDGMGNTVTENAAAILIENGELRRHARKARQIYAGRRESFAKTLETALGDRAEFRRPAGGLAFWVRFRGDMDRIEEKAVAAGLRFASSRSYMTRSDAPRGLQVAVIAHEGVDPFVEAKQGDRQRVLTCGEHDREMALRVDEFVRGQRDRMGCGEIGCAFKRAGFPVRMVAAVERQKVLVEQRKLRLRRAGHDIVSENGGG